MKVLRVILDIKLAIDEYISKVITKGFKACLSL
jgi:hypothetical protein